MAIYYVVIIDNRNGTFCAPTSDKRDHIFRSRFSAEGRVMEWNQKAKRYGMNWRYIVVEVEHDE